MVSQAKAAPGQSVFTTSGVFTVPKGIKNIEVFVVGGGGGTYDISGVSVQDSTSQRTRGGGGGGYTATGYVNVYPGQQIGVTVGSGGREHGGGESNAGGVVANGATLFNDGGSGGAYGTHGAGTCGGGSDGSDGGLYEGTYNGGKGQGTTTRAFGESWGTLYAGGGGGWKFRYAPNINGGPGGAGGGGNGTTLDSVSGDPENWYVLERGTWGAAGTGGGCGGGVCVGGSGAVLIRWS